MYILSDWYLSDPILCIYNVACLDCENSYVSDSETISIECVVSDVIGYSVDVLFECLCYSLYIFILGMVTVKFIRLY